MALSPVTLAPPQYGVQSPRPDLMQSAGTFALAYVEPSTPQPPPTDLKTLLADLTEKFEASEEQSRDARERAERDVDYYDGKQISAKDMATLEKRGQPALQLDQIKAKVNFLQGLERSQRTDPRALPRNPGQDEADATSATDALRFIAEKNRYDQTRSRVFRDLVTAGWGGVEVSVEGKTAGGNPNISQGRTPWDRMFWDPHSSQDDFDDAAYRGLQLWMDRQQAIRRWGDGADKVFDETLSGDIGGNFDDKPKIWTWSSSKRKRVRVAQIYYQDDDTGEWHFCEYTRGGILSWMPSPWKDPTTGEPTHPYVWRSAYVDRENNRYGEIRAIIDGQDALNKIASKLLHLFTVRQTFGTPRADALQNVNERKKQLSQPDGHLSMPDDAKWGQDFGIIPTNDLSAGMVQMMSVWQGQMNRSGPSATIMGKGDSDASGRSIMAQQQGGTLEAGVIFDAARDMDHEVHRKSWGLVRQLWTQEEWIRVTEDPRTIRFVGLNEVARDPMGNPVIDPMTGQPAVARPVAELDVDIIVSDAPASQSLHGETFQAFTKLASVSPSMQNLPAEFWLEISDLPHKDRAIQLLTKYQKDQKPDPMQVAGAEAELRNTEADTEMKAAKAEHSRALAAVDTLGAVHDHADHIAQTRRGGISPDLPYEHVAQAVQAERQAQQQPPF